MAVAIATLTGAPLVSCDKKPAAAPPKPKASVLDPDLDVVKRSKGAIQTTIDEFYKVGPGPSSSHTIGPMRITYDFYQRATKLPADVRNQATALKVNLFGSLSATGKGHGTERASARRPRRQGARRRSIPRSSTNSPPSQIKSSK